MPRLFPLRNRMARPDPRVRAGRAAALSALALLALAGCAQHLQIYPQVDRLVASGKYAEAAKLVESRQADYGATNAVLWQLDRGLLYHYAGRYDESNKAFEEAERRMDALFTESITGNVAAFISNDNTLPYRGEDFESVTVNLYRALNYAAQGNLEAALVEARKVDQKLDFINRQYEPDHKNAYKEDAFARLLMGVFYEAAGTRNDLNDAFISDRLAAGIYEKDFQPNYGAFVPELLKSNLLSTAAFMGREETGEALKRFPGAPVIPLADKRARGQLYFVHFAGRAPVKVEDKFMAGMPDGNLFAIAMPRYRPTGYLVTGSRVLVNGAVAATLELGHPTGAIAVKNLQNRIGRIRAKAVARAVTKYIANRALQKRAEKEGGAAQLFAYVAGNVATAVSEQADLRSWQTLPDRILVGRVLLPPGRHRIAVQYLTSGGGVAGTRDLGEVEVAAGRTRFFTVHSNL